MFTDKLPSARTAWQGVQQGITRATQLEPFDAAHFSALPIASESANSSAGKRSETFGRLSKASVINRAILRAGGRAAQSAPRRTGRKKNAPVEGLFGESCGLLQNEAGCFPGWAEKGLCRLRLLSLGTRRVPLGSSSCETADRLVCPMGSPYSFLFPPFVCLFVLPSPGGGASSSICCLVAPLPVCSRDCANRAFH